MANFIESVLSDELNILIVSSNVNHSTQLQEKLHSTWKDQLPQKCFRCKIHVSPNVSCVIQQSEQQINFDYIIFIVDMTVFTCVKEVQESLKMLGSFSRQKISLVCLRGKTDNVSPLEIWGFVRYYQLNLIFADLEKEEKAKNLAKKLLNLIETHCGVTNGVPQVGNV